MIILVQNSTLQAIDSAVGKFGLHFESELHTQGDAKRVLERYKMNHLELELWGSQGCMMFMRKNAMLKIVEITMWHGATAWYPLPESQLAVGVMACVSVTLCWRPVLDAIRVLSAFLQDTALYTLANLPSVYIQFPLGEILLAQ